jgi:hypothetical protein
MLVGLAQLSSVPLEAPLQLFLGNKERRSILLAPGGDTSASAPTARAILYFTTFGCHASKAPFSHAARSRFESAHRFLLGDAEKKLLAQRQTGLTNLIACGLLNSRGNASLSQKLTAPAGTEGNQAKKSPDRAGRARAIRRGKSTVESDLQAFPP